MIPELDRRPILIALAGPNGAGKTTFFHAHLSYTNLPFVNADIIAAETGLGSYEAAELAEVLRRERFNRRESFIFETVFYDPIADKLHFLEEATSAGYTVVLFFIGISSAARSVDRVGMHVMEGGHAVHAAKLTMRFPRILENLRLSLLSLPNILVYDNDDLRHPYRLVLTTQHGKVTEKARRIPAWLRSILPQA